MNVADLLRETLDTAGLECWQRERTATPIRAFAVRLHAAGLSLRETAAMLGLLGGERSHGAVWNWVHRLADSVPDPPAATPRRVAVDETAVRINGEWSWVYAAIDLDSKLLLDIAVFGRRGTDPAAAFLHGLTQKHDPLWKRRVYQAGTFGVAVADERLYVGGATEYDSSVTRLNALAVDDGTSVWQTDLPANPTTAPTVVGDTVLVGCEDGNLYALDVASGTQKWQFKVGGAEVFAPAVADGPFTSAVSTACMRSKRVRFHGPRSAR